MEITLDQLLASRERRQQRQNSLMSDHPTQTLVCLTVIMPGAVKRNSHSLIIANAAITAVLECFKGTLSHIEAHDLTTGYEAYFLTSINPMEAKRITTELEDTHPLGRLFDLDVFHPDGTPMNRNEVGRQPRQCLLCDNEARYCMRAHSHTTAQLLDRIREMVDQYVG